MRSLTRLFLPLLIACLLLYACQREFSFEQGEIAEGTLLKSPAGDCEPIAVGGNFMITKPLTDSNYLEVSLQISKRGSYVISTDTVNGYSFKANGSFSNVGLQVVRLKASGVPVIRGTDHFLVQFDSSLCEANVTVANNVADPAIVTLVGGPSTCTNSEVEGAFVAGYALDTTNTVTISVEVIEPGYYAFSTTTINGYNFTAGGIFTDRGLQTVKLMGGGTPVAVGSNGFAVEGNGTSCSFTVNVVNPVPVTNTDHFPLTNASYWAYSDSYFDPDSVARSVSGTAVHQTVEYVTVSEHRPLGINQILNFRKEGNDYFEYAPVDKYTRSFQFKNVTEGEIPFLKEGLNNGDTWVSPEYSGLASFDQQLFLQYQFVCLNNNAVVALNGNVYASVYKIRMYPYIRSEFAGYGSSGEYYDFYYALGIGMIYSQKTTIHTPENAQILRSWVIQ